MWESSFEMPFRIALLIISISLVSKERLILDCDSLELLLLCRAFSVPPLSVVCRFVIFMITVIPVALMISVLLVSPTLVSFKFLFTVEGTVWHQVE